MSAVLIAEPEADVRGFLVRHLADDGFDVLGADGGTEALELAARSRPDLVLLGDQSALDGFADVPVIVIGDAQADAVDRVRAFARGCDDFVGRPFQSLFNAFRTDPGWRKGGCLTGPCCATTAGADNAAPVSCESCPDRKGHR